MVMFWVAHPGHQHSALRAARRVRSRRRHAVRPDAAARRRRRAMLSAVAPIWDGNETWLVVTGVILWGAFPVVYATLLSAFYLPLIVMLAGPDPARRGVRISQQDRAAALDLGCELCRRIPGRDFHPGRDGRRPGGGACRSRTANIPAASSAGSVPLRCCAASACASAMRLLGACWLVRKCEGEVRDVALSPDPVSRGRRAGLPGRRLRLRAGRKPSDPASMDRAAVSVRLPGDRRGRGDRARGSASCVTTMIGRSTWSR